jgi:hypothetical protein
VGHIDRDPTPKKLNTRRVRVKVPQSGYSGSGFEKSRRRHILALVLAVACAVHGSSGQGCRG